MKLAWITDTGALLSPSFIEKHQINVVPLSLVFEDGCYREGTDLTAAQVYDKMRATKKHPTSAQPNFGDHVALYERLKNEGYDAAIALHISSKQSGTFANAAMAAEQAGFTTYPIDTQIGSHPIQKMVELGLKMAQEGATPKEIVQAIEEMRDRAELLFIPANLEKLHKSGRVSGSAMFLSNLLNIKLVIKYEDGVCVVAKKVRAEKRAREAILTRLQQVITTDGVKEVAIIHTNAPELAETWRITLQSQFPNIIFQVTELSAVVGLLTGEGTLGLTWVRES
ncbi:DegV domain-containing protein [Lysinibacillus alkalisoli]|uniref:DegV domain-containing protein n=1 Tax=Lysinibacillus alkalisoli TaxID=1911548 RepID=A0A917LEN5_9BACI|nr:DegV family protein [Lysinibacillus alkalisoli]GGG16006.1 DegV domain-containing protein [Lysinibacillus alkalisoli]